MSPSLTALETIMWRAGQDPSLQMTVGNLVILDRLPVVDDLVGRLTAAAWTAPRLRWRLDDPSRSRGRPGWVDNPDFDARQHVRLLSLPAPGDQRQLLDLVALVDTAQFDPARSPWDITVLDGLAGGRAAVFVRADHLLTDGLGGTGLVQLLFDEVHRAEPVAAAVAPPPQPERPPDAPRDAPPDPPPYVSARRPGTVTLTVDLTSFARPVAAGIAAARVLDPVDTVVRGVQRGFDMVNSVSRQLVVPGGALSPLPPSGSRATRFELLQVPGARQAARRHGGSRNDLLVAAAAAGLGAYHARQGQPVTALRMAAPVLVRRTRAQGGNSFAPLRVEVPASGAHAGEQFGIVADRLARARHEPATHLLGPLTTAINMLPARALLPAIRAQIGTVDFIATTLPGLRHLGSLCGAQVLASYPFGPRAGRLVNITALGNGDTLELGIALDPGAIREPDVLVECIEQAFARLIESDSRPSEDA